MYRDQVLENFYIIKEASAEMSRVERHARNVDKAATKSLPRLHAHTVKLEEHYDVPIPMKKKAALENFYMVKEALDPLSGSFLIGSAAAGLLGREALSKYYDRKNRKKAVTPVQTPKSEIRGKGNFKSRRMGKGKAALLTTAGGLATGLLANEAYKKYKKSRN